LRLVVNQKAPTPQAIGTWLRHLKNYFNKIIFALKNYSNSPSSIRNFEKLLEVSARDWNNETEGAIVPVVGLDRASLATDIKAVTNGYDFVIIKHPHKFIISFTHWIISLQMLPNPIQYS
jgi:hypothetical protein